MSTSSKLGPKAIAVKRMLHHRLGLTRKRFLQHSQNAGDEWIPHSKKEIVAADFPSQHFCHSSHPAAVPEETNVRGGPYLISKSKSKGKLPISAIEAEGNGYEISVSQLREFLSRQKGYSYLYLTEYYRGAYRSTVEGYNCHLLECVDWQFASRRRSIQLEIAFESIKEEDL